jgi:3-polyprenyl-4-hydroxybenzoate decarboxylase/protein-L-isoaspartate O-methyltransferase
MEPKKWALLRNARIAEQRQTLTVFGPVDVRRFEGDSAALARSVLALLRVPHDRAELLAALAAEFEDVGQRPEIVDQLLGHLEACGVVGPRSPRAESRGAGARIVVASTGAIATAFSPLLVSLLQASGAEVRVALTRAAKKFVAPRALEALTHAPVVSSLWSGAAGEPAPHIALAEWADLVVIAPASATTIARLVRGDCSDVVSATAIATRAPVIIAPSMSPGMFDAPSVQRNLEQLKADGFHVVWPSWGVEVAEKPGARRAVFGPMLPPEELVAIIRALTPPRAVAPRPDAVFWDGVYSHTPADQLPWHSAVLDADLEAALKEGRGRLLDLGCGLGTVAIAAAKLGYEVTASDVSSVALEGARKAAGPLPISFVADDILSSKLEGPFDVIVDRAVLHTLPSQSHDRYLRSIARLMKPGGRLMLKVHSDLAQTRMLGTQCFDESRLATLVAPELVVESCKASRLQSASALWVQARRT